MLRIGLTGGIGCGKSTVAKLFSHLGAQIIDTDVIAHELTKANGTALPLLRNEFGTTYFHSDGTLDRHALRELVFSQAQAKLKLEAILHPLILSETLALCHKASSAPYLLIVVPLLLSSPDFLRLVERVLVVDCDEAMQIERVVQRNQLNAQQIKNIIARQTPRAAQLAAADDIIANQLDLNHLSSEVRRLHDIYLQQSSIND